MGAHHRPDTDDAGWTWTGQAWRWDAEPLEQGGPAAHPFDRPHPFVGGSWSSGAAAGSLAPPAPPADRYARAAARAVHAGRRWWKARSSSDRRVLLVLGSALVLVLLILVVAVNSGPTAPQWSAAEQELIADAHSADIHPYGDDVIVNVGRDVCSTDTVTSLETQVNDVQVWGADRGQEFNLLAHEDLCPYLRIPLMPALG